MLTFHALTVIELRREVGNALCITLQVPPHLEAAYRFVPGQHLGLRAIVNGQELRRTYSICSLLDEQQLRIGVRIYEQGSMSRYLAHTLRVGDTLDVLTPAGRFFAAPDPSARRTYCAFAAGSGITPILGILSNLLAHEPHSRFQLFYGNRSTASIMFAEELLALKDRYPQRLALYFILSREPQDVALFNGRIDRHKTELLGTTLFDPQGIDAFYLCGPGTMIDGVREALLALGVAGSRIHSERFVTDALQPGLAVEKSSNPAQPMTQVTIVIDGRRRSFAMERSGVTLLEAAEREGLDLPYSCRAGVCSICRSKVIQGTVTMRENYALEPWEVEQGYVLCCQSVPVSADLELNYDER